MGSGANGGGPVGRRDAFWVFATASRSGTFSHSGAAAGRCGFAADPLRGPPRGACRHVELVLHGSVRKKSVAVGAVRRISGDMECAKLLQIFPAKQLMQ